MRLGRDRGHAGFAGHEHLGAFADGLGDQAVLAAVPGGVTAKDHGGFDDLSAGFFNDPQLGIRRYVNEVASSRICQVATYLCSRSDVRQVIYRPDP